MEIYRSVHQAADKPGYGGEDHKKEPGTYCLLDRVMQQSYQNRCQNDGTADPQGNGEDPDKRTDSKEQAFVECFGLGIICMVFGKEKSQ